MKKKLESNKKENKKEAIAIKEQNPNRLEKSDPRQFKVVGKPIGIESNYSNFYINSPLTVFEMNHKIYLAYSSGIGGNELIIYNLHTNQVETTLKGFYKETITSIEYYKSPDGRHYLLIKGDYQEAYVFLMNQNFELLPVRYLFSPSFGFNIRMIFSNGSYELISAKYKDFLFKIGLINEKGEIKRVEISETISMPKGYENIIDSYSSEKYNFLIFGSQCEVVLYELDSKKKGRIKLFNGTNSDFHSFLKIKGELTLCLCTKNDIEVWNLDSHYINKLYSFKNINYSKLSCIFNWDEQFLLIGKQDKMLDSQILVVDLSTQEAVKTLKSEDCSNFLLFTKITDSNEDYLVSIDKYGLITNWSSTSN